MNLSPKAKINKWDLIRLKSLFTVKETIKKTTYEMGENIFRDITNKKLISISIYIYIYIYIDRFFFNQNKNNEKKICCDRKQTTCFQDLQLISKGQEKTFWGDGNGL